MTDLTIDLHEELEAFDPAWRERFPSIAAAARAAGVSEMYGRWLRTPDGCKYAAAVKGLSDHVGDSKREAEAMRAPTSLPFGYDNLGLLPNASWGDEGEK